MTERNISKLTVGVLGIYSLTVLIVSFLWTGNFWSLVFLILSLGIFAYSLFNRQVGFFLLLIVRTAFDSLGAQELFKFFSISVNFTFLLGVMLIALAALTAWEKRAELKKMPLLKIWIIFLGLIAFLSLFSFSKQASAVEFFRLLSFCSAFIFGYLIFNTPRALTNLAKAVIFSAIIPASVAWWQLINRSGFFDGDRWRLLGTFVHPNMLAFYLVFAIVLSLFVALNLKKDSIERIPYGVLAIFFLIPLIFTYTRAAWLALAFILFCLGVFKFRKLLLISIAAGFILYFFFPAFQERVSSLSSVSAADSSAWRLDLWRDMIVFIKASPWFGYGPGTASLFIQKNIPRFLIATEPHNDYLKIWLESGIFTLLAYLYLYLAYLKKFWQGFNHENRPRLKMLTLFVGLFAISLAGASLTDNILKDAVLQWVFWSLSGGILAALILPVNKKEPLK
jgi:O-antigen ligase